ncbi:hypothetical protein PF005_g19987 [Phytophthora fragariae]|uniref:Uncharacterized protein n=1 Tax=Phytophthora fragariae TaxID=53985 RepID=A0A6A3WPN6_9STRA|nr:hypothetical protein PF003_g1639 [Phytophthora fragariae]KAE8980978.1 hypothetical protein PF011_g22217 [Phytophthora fragariae]KAE9099575.1 hypothetical protein PF006_g23103 [Phytophthora fragariae]KAE9188398.1 hypothetical protein PF004_g22515 [Phytophthora fragariae]KAE9188611.1 hypothetical protein PF005_g19987 [Phytophthora fragariae]
MSTSGESDGSGGLPTNSESPAASRSSGEKGSGR